MKGSTMESLARRGVRTTVAVAGFAALGVGMAAPAFAAPNLPEVSGIGSVPASPTGQPAGPSSQFSNASDVLGELPAPFNFAMPTVPQAAPTDAAASAPSDSPSTDAASSESPASSAPSDQAATTPDAATPATPSTGALPGLPALPVGMPKPQAGPEVPNLDGGSALQALDAAGTF
jgi:hypothetical protein